MAETTLSEMEVQCLVQNLNEKTLVPPLREIHARSSNGQAKKRLSNKHQKAVALQQQWDSWLVQKELLSSQIKRGTECLEQVRSELAARRADLEEWTAYERVCGKNPLIDYMYFISAKERIAKFLPGWLRRQQTQLNSLNRKMELCAKQTSRKHQW